MSGRWANIEMKQVIYIIGMAGSGKSTVGKKLAKMLELNFVDLDTEIEKEAKKSLTQIKKSEGIAGVKFWEEKIMLLQECEPGRVVATGGSVIYSEIGMQYLKETGQIIWLRVSMKELERRKIDLTRKGLVIKRTFLSNYPAKRSN
jgi:shikimate kinase